MGGGEVMARILVDNDWGDEEREGSYGTSEMLMMLLSRVRRLENTVLSNNLRPGIKGWNFDPVILASPAAFTGSRIPPGQLHLSKMPIIAAVSLSAIIFSCTTTSSMTNVYAAIFDTAGNRLGITGNVASMFNTTGMKTLPLTAPTDILTDNYVWVGILAWGGVLTFCPILGESEAIDAFASGSTTFARFGCYGSGLTAMPASLTMASMDPPARAIFAAVA